LVPVAILPAPPKRLPAPRIIFFWTNRSRIGVVCGLLLVPGRNVGLETCFTYRSPPPLQFSLALGPLLFF
jgi:hypothetical protein